MDNMFDETLQRVARKQKIQPINFQHPKQEEIQNCFSRVSPDPVSVILTGTAGDGKTHLCRQVWKMLKGGDEGWASDDPYLTIQFGYPAYGQDRGSFVSTYKKDNDISLKWPLNLTRAQEQELISESTATSLLTLFQTFQQSYLGAIKGFTKEGLACNLLLKQAEDFGILLHAICTEAKGDRNREWLLRPLLEIGIVAVEGGRVTAIVTPWHPLRLAAMANKALQVSSLIRHPPSFGLTGFALWPVGSSSKKPSLPSR
jgi:hypothetical protein